MGSLVSTKIDASIYKELKDFCDKSGQSVLFHVNAAMKNYMADVFPRWKVRLKAVEEDLKGK